VPNGFQWYQEGKARALPVTDPISLPSSKPPFGLARVVLGVGFLLAAACFFTFMLGNIWAASFHDSHFDRYARDSITDLAGSLVSLLGCGIAFFSHALNKAAKSLGRMWGGMGS
jgi:hypothetical protein